MILLPFVFQPSTLDSFRWPKVKVFVFLACIWAAYHIWIKIKPSLACGFLLASASGIYHTMGAPILEALVPTWAALCSAFWVVNPDRRDIDVIMKPVVVGGALCALYGYLQMFNMEPLNLYYRAWTDPTIPTALLGQQTLFGVFVGACLVAALSQRMWLFALFMAGPVIATQSSFVIGSTVAGVMVVTSRLWGMKLSLFLTLMGILTLVGMYHIRPHNEIFNSSGRGDIYLHQLRLASKVPLSGFGYGTFKVGFHKVQSVKHKKDHGKYLQSHNDYIQMIFELGFLSILVMGWMFWDFFRALWRHWAHYEVVGMGAVFIVFAVDALASFPFRLVPQGVLALWCWIGVTTYRGERQEWQQINLLNYLPWMKSLKKSERTSATPVQSPIRK